MVTGATRGIGKATAVALARSGWDVAVTGRTVREGDGRDESDTGGGRLLPGSLEATGLALRAHGRRTLELVADLHNTDAVRAAAAAVVAEWGGVDLLVNNAVDTGPGSMVPVLDLTVAQFEAKLAANVVAQFVTVDELLPGMLEQGGGTILNVTSHTATADPPGPVGHGGWGLAYAASKAAFHRFAPLLAVELVTAGSGHSTWTPATWRPNASWRTPARSAWWAATVVRLPRCPLPRSPGWQCIPKARPTARRSRRSSSR